MSVPSRRRRAGARRALDRGERLKLVRFLVGGTIYAFDVGDVEEVVQPSAVTELPELPRAVLGVGDHRGSVIPIVDLRTRFGLEPASPSRAAKWLLTRIALDGRSDPLRVGFLVDRVLDVNGTDEPPRAPPSLTERGSESAIAGVVTIDGAPSFVLDLRRLTRELASVSGSAPSTTRS
jgi:purine-binding chemotaxis protein CheW